MRQATRAAESHPSQPPFRVLAPPSFAQTRLRAHDHDGSGRRGTGLSLYLDGTQLARIKAGEALTVYLTPPWHFLREHPLFSPKVGQLVDLRSGGPATVRIVDRDGNYHFSVATRGLFWPLHRIVSDWGERPVTHPHAGE